MGERKGERKRVAVVLLMFTATLLLGIAASASDHAYTLLAIGLAIGAAAAMFVAGLLVGSVRGES